MVFIIALHTGPKTQVNEQTVFIPVSTIALAIGFVKTAWLPSIDVLQIGQLISWNVVFYNDSLYYS